MSRSPRVLLAALILLLVPAAGASHPQDDAGSGADAGWRPAESLPVAPGTFTGTLEPPADAVDWYRIELPEAHWLSVATATDGLCVEVFDGRTIDELSRSGFNYCDASRDYVMRVFSGTMFVRVRLPEDAPSGLVAYDVTLAFLPMPNLRMAATPVGHEDGARAVTGTVFNDGAVAIESASLSFIVRSHAFMTVTTARCEADLGSLAPGEARSFVVAYEAVGWVNVRVVASSAQTEYTTNDNGNSFPTGSGPVADYGGVGINARCE